MNESNAQFAIKYDTNNRLCCQRFTLLISESVSFAENMKYNMAALTHMAIMSRIVRISEHGRFERFVYASPHACDRWFESNCPGKHLIVEMISKSKSKKFERKQKRAQHLIMADSGVFCSNQPTQVDDKCVEIIKNIQSLRLEMLPICLFLSIAIRIWSFAMLVYRRGYNRKYFLMIFLDSGQFWMLLCYATNPIASSNALAKAVPLQFTIPFMDAVI